MNTETKTKILAVDDNQNNLIALESVFYSSEYQMIEAKSGMEALELLKIHDDIALILLDVQMPEMDGYETARRIKEREESHDIPIIFITAFYREDPYVKKGYDSGAVDYFGKPFDPELLKKKVDIYSSFRKKNILLKEREARIKEAEELLRTSRKLSHILEKMNVAILISDPKGEIYQCNEPASHLLSAEKLEGEDHYGQILSWWNGDGCVLKGPGGILWSSLKERKSTHNHKFEITCLDGQKRELIASASPLIESDGELKGAVIILADTSESRKIEEEFEKQVTQLVSSELHHTHFS